MSAAGRRTNLALLVLLAAAFGTGLAAFTVGVPRGRWVVIGHGLAGLAIVVLVPWKSVVVRRGLRRRRSGRILSLALAVTVTVTIALGVAHSVGVARIGPFTTMQVHVGAAIVAAPLAVFHLVARPVRPRRLDLGRRSLLRGAGVTIGAVAVFGGLEGLMRLAGWPGARRRFTGSHERGSFDPVAMPVTQWLNDPVPRIATDEWALTVGSRSGERRFSFDDLSRFDDRLTATLDCTGGWYATQTWEGVRLERLLDDADGRSIAVRSATGYARRFPRSDAERLLIAVRVGDGPLSAGHGSPARLVAPGRRGFWWVKWVVEISVDDTPWWVQPPLPLT